MTLPAAPDRRESAKQGERLTLEQYADSAGQLGEIIDQAITRDYDERLRKELRKEGLEFIMDRPTPPPAIPTEPLKPIPMQEPKPPQWPWYALQVSVAAAVIAWQMAIGSSHVTFTLLLAAACALGATVAVSGAIHLGKLVLRRDGPLA
jgi:hypothetical protein